MLTSSPRLQRSSLGPGRDAERVRHVDVEAAWSLPLDQCVADRRDAVVDREHPQLVAVAGEHVARHELDQVVLVRETPEDAPQRAEQVA